MTGDKLLRYCSSAALGEQIYCFSYILGMADGIDAYQAHAPEIDKKICKPKDFDMGLLKIIVADHLEKHPKDRHLSAASSVFQVLRETYPCNKPVGGN